MARIYFIILLLWGCSSIERISHPRFEFAGVSQIIIRPGMVDLLVFRMPGHLNGADLICNNKSMKYYIRKKWGISYLSESYFSKLNPYNCILKSAGISHKVSRVEVIDYKFPEERLNVAKKRVFLTLKDRKRVARERAILNKIYTSSTAQPLFNKAFDMPLKSLITSYYGTRRIFNNKKRSQHLGTDFRAGVGVPIPSANDGVVVFAGNLFYTGNAIIVDHGAGIFTVYGHLSRIEVTNGQKISKGQVLGLAGKTGRVSGPHLHWGVKVNNRWVDGFSLINASRIALRVN